MEEFLESASEQDQATLGFLEDDELCRHLLIVLHESAKKYIGELERDKRLTAARYVVQYKENPENTRDMGFLQYVNSLLTGNKTLDKERPNAI